VILSYYYCELPTIEVFTERGIATAGGSAYPHAYGVVTHGGRNLRNNYAPPMRSENWDLLYPSISSSVPRRGYSQWSTLTLLSYSAFRWLGFSVPSFTATKLHFVSSSGSTAGPVQQCEMIRLFTSRTPPRIKDCIPRTTSCRNSGKC